MNEKNGENLLKHSYPTTSIFNDPINYSVSGMLRDGQGLEANQRNLLPLEALEVLIYGPGLYRSAQLLLLIELHCPRPLPPLPFLAQDEWVSLGAGVPGRKGGSGKWAPCSPSCSVVTASVSALKSLSPMSLVAFRRSL